MDEKALKDRHFPSLAPSLMRKLLRRGHWQSLPAGTRLTRTGIPVEALWYLFEGMARVEVDGTFVGRCAPGGFIGDMTVASGEPAFADVVLESPAKAWRIEAPDLRAISERRPEIGHALKAAFFRMIRERLAHSNSNARVRAEAAVSGLPWQPPQPGDPLTSPP